MTDKQPSFSERRERVEQIAGFLGETAQMLATCERDLRDEADRMATAEKRFADKRTGRSAKASV
jgi:hypothetical protein